MMNNPASVLLLLFLLAGFASTAQPSDAPAYKIDNSNHTGYYKKAQQLLTTSDEDSLIEACMILNKLSYFDSVTYSKKSLAPYFSKIEAINLNHIKSNIAGQWNFEWEGNAFTLTRPRIERNETIIFTASEAFFYSNDTLVRKTAYSITNDFTYFKEFKFQIYFHDDKSAKNISIRTKGADYVAHIKLSPENMSLYLDEPGDFNNHSAVTIYMKQPASNYRLGYYKLPNNKNLPVSKAIPAGSEQPTP